MISFAADSAIGVYQRYISPYKGFRCAHHAHTGQRSCSAYARGIVKRLGAFALIDAMPRQFERCKAAYAAILETRASTKSEESKKDSRWYDSCDCGACDIPFNFLGKGNHCDLPCDGDIGVCDCSPQMYFDNKMLNMNSENISETEYLRSIPDMVESIIEGMNEPVESCATELDW